MSECTEACDALANATAANQSLNTSYQNTLTSINDLIADYASELPGIKSDIVSLQNTDVLFETRISDLEAVTIFQGV